MNIISQFVLGAAVGSLVASKKMGNKAVLWGGLCALIPSLDWLLSFLFETTTAIYIYGGVTHSFVFCVLFAPIMGWVVRKFVGDGCSIILCSCLALCCMLVHCLTDVFSIVGVGLLEPFSHKRFSLAILSDFDWISMIPLVAAFVAVFFVKDCRQKAMVSWFGLFLFVVYVAFSFLNKLSVQSQFEQKLEEQNLRYSRTEVFPVSGAMFMWNCIAQDRDGFWICNQSNLSKNDFEMNLALRNDYYLFEVEANPSVRRLEAYSKFYYVVEPKSDRSVVLHDLRFGKYGYRLNDKYKSSYEIFYQDPQDVLVTRVREKH